jgi:hypothetical protein
MRDMMHENNVEVTGTISMEYEFLLQIKIVEERPRFGLRMSRSHRRAVAAG